MAVYTFTYATWAARYPELASTVTSATAALYFAEAIYYVDNTDTSVVDDVVKRGVVLNAVVAHIAALAGALSGGLPSGTVGRITSATQGSVTVSLDHALPGTAAWYAQTQYGASAWQMMKPYRMGRYIAGPPRANDTLDQFWQGLAR